MVDKQIRKKEYRFSLGYVEIDVHIMEILTTRKGRYLHIDIWDFWKHRCYLKSQCWKRLT